jgi:hypothetical protein
MIDIAVLVGFETIGGKSFARSSAARMPERL